jgi:D-aminopeptidase
MSENNRPRGRDLGLSFGKMPVGRDNGITDVSGVKVGHETMISGEAVRTGLTAILPHGGNLYREKVPGAIFVGNGYGKLAGSTQVNELGEIETPIMLTNTLCVPRVADSLIDYMLAIPGNEEVWTVNPLVGETNDGYLNDIRMKNVGRNETFRAIRNAKSGLVEEGCVGAGTGTRALGWKGGIGTSSRICEKYSLGALVQANYGGLLTINGAPVGRELKAKNDFQYSGSVMVVIATDAPLDFRNLGRIAKRAYLGLSRTGFISENQSGDYFIAFSTAEECRIDSVKFRARNPEILRNDEMDPLFLGAVEATEEAVYNSLFRATTVRGKAGHVVEALPIEETLHILREYRAMG